MGADESTENILNRSGARIASERPPGLPKGSTPVSGFGEARTPARFATLGTCDTFLP